jgi:uncharacterized membrane protein
MKCSKCSNEMVEGKAHIGGGGTTLLLTGGISFGNLTFKAANWRDHVVQETSDVLPAHYCDNCGAVTIETPRRGLSTLEC